MKQSFWVWAGLAFLGIISLSFVSPKYAWYSAAILLLGGLVYIQNKPGGLALFLNELTNGAYYGQQDGSTGGFNNG